VPACHLRGHLTILGGKPLAAAAMRFSFQAGLPRVITTQGRALGLGRTIVSLAPVGHGLATRIAVKKGDAMVFSASCLSKAFRGVLAAFKRVLRLGRK